MIPMEMARIITRYSGHFDVTEKVDDWERVGKTEKFACTIIERYCLGVGVGQFQVINKETRASKTLNVTRFTIGCSEKYQAWLDEEASVTKLGKIVIDILTKDKNGIYPKPNSNQDMVLLQQYGRNSEGIVYVNSLTSYGRKEYSSIGTHLMQIAAERSQALGFGFKIFLETNYEAPGFYRKIKLTTGSASLDQDIESEEAAAKKEGRSPFHWKHFPTVHYMRLEENGYPFFQALVTSHRIITE